MADGRAATRDRARYVEEREHRVAYARGKYHRDPERSRAYSRDWRASNGAKRRLQSLRRRARKYGNPGFVDVTLRDWRIALRLSGGLCTYCRSTGPLVMDHIIPLARGGRHAPANITPACVPCNSSKSDLLLSEWRHRRPKPPRR